jgi:Tol biopolymer transport system component
MLGGLFLKNKIIEAIMIRRSWIFVFIVFLAACVWRPSPALFVSVFRSPLTTSSMGINEPEVIIFQSTRSGSTHYYMITPDGRNLQMFGINAPEGATVEELVWSPALKKILLALNGEIYISDREGKNLFNLTNTPFKVESHPVPSPDGQYIAFICVESDLDICVMRSDGAERLNLTAHPAREVDPQWSPDGTKIAFLSNREGIPNIFIINRDGSGLFNLTKSPCQDSTPSWSPDGRKILFNRNFYGNMEIFIVDVQRGSVPVNLTNHPAQDVEPTWSPDGNLIAFRSDREGRWDIFVMQPDGASPINLTQSVEMEIGHRWAPDGRHLVYTAQIGGQFEVFIVGVEGKRPINLTNHPADDFAPIWIKWNKDE